jgi:4-hydroxy-tetrahydrodipicolinate reductase
MGAVKFAVVGKVNGVPRVVLEHITRTDPEQVPEWETPPQGADGCYRIKITGEPMMQVDFTHHGAHGDHNVSGMITTAQRIINALPAVVAAEAGIVRALDLPLVTGRGLVSST